MRGGDFYKRALVLGLGRSGEAAARLLRGEGTAVTVLDQKDTPELALRADVLRAEGIAVVLGATVVPAGDYDVAVVSPGIANTSPWLRVVVPAGVAVISELELGASRCHCPLLAITGTNGKSTLTKLCMEALVEAGLRAACGGNYGIPLAELAPRSRELDWLVVEVSSFQLETADRFHPRVAVLLNIQPNHLDRHGSLETYAQLKCRIFQNMGEGDTAVVLDALLEDVRGRVGGITAGTAGSSLPGWRTFGVGVGAEYRYEAGRVRVSGGRVLDLQGTRFENPILGQAAAAGLAALAACGVGMEAFARAVSQYQPLPHRMNDLGEIRGVRFINDSKATTLAAMCAGLGMTPGRVRLIAGGLLKEKDLAGAQEMLAKKACALYVIGNAAPLMQTAWESVVPCRSCGGLEQAVKAAWRDAERGDTVLLSPGCASFDQFRSFEERGEQFERFVRRIREEAGNENVVVG